MKVICLEQPKLGEKSFCCNTVCYTCGAKC